MAFMTAAPAMFKVAAVLNAISIPGHTVGTHAVFHSQHPVRESGLIYIYGKKYGFDHVYPAVNTIPPSEDHVVGKRGAQDAWNYMNWSLAIAALLNWQWSQTGGPQTPLEKVMFWTLLVGGGTSGFRYFQVNSYKPLFCLWVAPAFALAGLAMT